MIPFGLKELGEMNREQILSIFCELVDRLREKREFEVIEAAYNRLRRCDFIPPEEDFINGKLVEGSIDEALLFRFHLAFVKSKTRDDIPIPDEIKDTPCTLEELGDIFK